MATALGRLELERSIKTLARRLYVINEPGKAEKQRRAERALLRANPGLSDPKNFRPGLVVLVPNAIGLKTTKRVSAPAADIKGGLEETALRLQVSAQMYEESFQRSAAADKKILAELGLKDFSRQLRKALPKSAKAPEAFAKVLQERAKENKKNLGRFDQAFKKAQEEIDRLRSLSKREE